MTLQILRFFYTIIGMVVCSATWANTIPITVPPHPDPTQIFQLVSTNLNPNSFEVTISLWVPKMRIYTVEACDGSSSDSNATWIALIHIQGGVTDEVFTFTDTVSPLSTKGKTYRGAVYNDDNTAAIYTANEIFIPYPYLENPVIRSVNVGNNNQTTIEYGEGIYSNTVSVALPPNISFGFFRVYSPDEYPTNAVIQLTTNLNSRTWLNVP